MVEGSEHAGDPVQAIGIASHQLECRAAEYADRLAGALDAAQQAIAFVSYADVEDDDEL